MYQVGSYILDDNQTEIVLDNSNNLLVVAGAGSGKTLTILGKIKHLVFDQEINPAEIICISFTKQASLSLKEKIKKELNLNLEVFTFHKLALEILKDYDLEIADPNLLADLVHLFFFETVLCSNYYVNLVKKYFNYRKDYSLLLKEKNKEIELLERKIITFIRLFKCNNFNISDFKVFFKKIRLTFSYKKYNREKMFLLLTLNIYLLYKDYLNKNKEIDFDDMIIKATDKVNTSFDRKIKYIIIDEYQDTSFIRFNLIKEIIYKTGSKLMVVGDDYQSIYRFTGCDIDLFLNFTKYFSDGKILKIENTYRNSSELVKVAGSFILKNNKQIKKNLKSSKSLKKPIKIIYYTDIRKTLSEIALDLDDDFMILGRNNKDISLIPDNLKSKFLTVHKSKGLESDNVIIINLIDDYLGFPNKIKDDSILRLVSLSKEKYPYSEERRLFYVALTRTKNNVYLLVPKYRKSIFVCELEHNYKRYISIRK